MTHVSSRRLREAAFHESVAALDAGTVRASTLVIDFADSAPTLAELDRRITAARGG